MSYDNSLWANHLGLLVATAYIIILVTPSLDNMYLCTKLKKNSESYHKFDRFWSRYVQHVRPMLFTKLQQDNVMNMVKKCDSVTIRV